MSHVIYEVFMEEVGKDPSFAGMDLCDLLAEANDKVGASGEPWQELLDRANISADAKTKLMEKHAWIANSLDSLTQSSSSTPRSCARMDSVLRVTQKSNRSR